MKKRRVSRAGVSFYICTHYQQGYIYLQVGSSILETTTCFKLKNQSCYLGFRFIL